MTKTEYLHKRVQSEGLRLIIFMFPFVTPICNQFTLMFKSFYLDFRGTLFCQVSNPPIFFLRKEWKRCRGSGSHSSS